MIADNFQEMLLCIAKNLSTYNSPKTVMEFDMDILENVTESSNI